MAFYFFWRVPVLQTMNTRPIVISDLDGTLLDPLTYSFGEALPAVDYLKRTGIPLILCSSKTRSEIELYRERLGNTDPFISENGGGIFIPERYFPFDTVGEQRSRYTVITLGKPYAGIRKVFSRLREQTMAKVRGFGDMTSSEVAAITGLPLSEAVLALNREFDEPFVFEEEKNREMFLSAIMAAGLSWTKGSIYHALGDNDKGKAVGVLKGFFKKAFGPVRTIGIGDSMNDLPMLRAVDCPVLVQKKGGGYEKGIEVPGLILAQGAGPEGWVSGLESVLRDY